MAGTMSTTGMEEISEMLARLEGGAEAAAAAGLYEGAGIMAAEIAAEAGKLKTSKFRYASGWQREASPEEAAVVRAAGGVGIAKFAKNGSEVDTSVGYGNAGYAQLNGRQVPIAKIANAINSGTSFMKKQPFIRKAASNGKKKAEQAIARTIEERLNKQGG